MRFVFVMLIAFPLFAHAAVSDIDLDATLPALNGQPYQECSEPIESGSCPKDKLTNQTLRHVLLAILLKGKAPPTVEAAMARSEFLHQIYTSKTIPALDDPQKHLIMDNILPVVGGDPVMIDDVVRLIDPTRKSGALQ
jgi:hypothetical protein